MKTPFLKVIEDLFDSLSKTVMVILAIALGVFGLGVIFDAYCITDREMAASYAATNPASFVVAIENPDNALFSLLQSNKEIEQIEQRKLILARVGTEADTWYETRLYIVYDWNAIDINTFYSLDGNAKPGKGEILLENSSFSVVKLKSGDNLNVKIPGYTAGQLTIVGSVQADGTNPAWMHEEVIGYINSETLETFGEYPPGSEFLITVSSNKTDAQYITSLSEAVRLDLEAHGYEISYVSMKTPGVHTNAAQMNAILLLFRVFGALALLLSVILVFSIISSILQGQVRQIAIMKSMGATTRQISLMYYAFVAIPGIVAAILAIPTAKAVSVPISDFAASILVFSIRDYSIPIWLYLIQISIAVFIPVMSATLPIQKGCRLSVNDGLHNTEMRMIQFRTKGIHPPHTLRVEERDPSHAGVERRVGKLPVKSVGISMGLRNALRKPLRLILSIITLAIGGAILMASVNVRVSLEKSFDQILSQYSMDTQFELSNNYGDDLIGPVLHSVDGIDRFSIATVTYASLVDEGEGGKTDIIYDNSGSVTVVSIEHMPSADLETTYRNTEKAFRENNIGVLSSITIVNAEVIYNHHLYTVASFLIGASAIVILVGLISLISLAGTSVMERMRELGIMRSFGTSTKAIFLVVYLENLLTGMFGFIVSILLAIPLSSSIGGQFGEIFLNKALPFVFSVEGLSIWFVLTIVINTVVSLSAVNKAARLSVHEVLAYN